MRESAGAAVARARARNVTTRAGARNVTARAGARIVPALALALAAGCRSAPAPAPRPALEQIFLGPGIAGEAPEPVALSPNGHWLLVRWRPVETDEHGAPRLEPGSALRLLFVMMGPVAGLTWYPEGAGRPLADWLPQGAVPPASSAANDEGSDDDDGRGEEGSDERDDRARLRAAWSTSGSTLAVAAGSAVYLVDPDEAAAELLLAPPDEPREPRAPRGDEADDDADDDAEDDGAPRLGTIRSLEFEDDDLALIVSDGEERYRLSLAARRPVALEDALCLSAMVAPRDSEVQWSDDYDVVFSPREPVVQAGGDGDDESVQDDIEQRESDDIEQREGDDDERRGPQVLIRSSGRTVELDGMAAIDELDDARLSPDGRWVFALEHDLSEAPAPTIVPDYLTERVSTRESRRALADDGPWPTRAWVWDTSSGARSELLFGGTAGLPELGARAEAGPGPPPGWYSGLSWAPQPEADDPARLAIARVTPDFRTRELWVWEPSGARLAVREHDPRWFGGPATRPHWSADGETLLFASELLASSTTPGRAQLFALDVVPGALRQLTAVEGEVTDFRPLPEGGIALQAIRDDPARRSIGVVDAGGGPVRWIGAPPGTNELPLVAASGTRVAFVHATIGTPGEIWGANPRNPNPLTDTEPYELVALDLPLPQRFETTAPDGERVRAHVWAPSLDDPDVARPAVVFVHGAGYLQNVVDSLTRYPREFLFNARLATLGYVVVDVDYRGSAGYGNAFRTAVQHHLGGKDLDDIHAVVDALVARGVVDPERVGIYGGSYGGFLTLMALFTAPERWAAGAALRSVTDWRTYHPRYTQPRLGRPSTHASAYELSSPIDHVENLEDPLLVLHGLVDSNVFAQDSIRLIEELIDRSLDFEAMLYPSQGHGFEDGRHWLDEYRRIERFLCEHLGPAPPPPSER